MQFRERPQWPGKVSSVPTMKKCCVHNPPFIRLSGCNLDTGGEDDQHLFRQLPTALSMVTWTLLPPLILNCFCCYLLLPTSGTVLMMNTAVFLIYKKWVGNYFWSLSLLYCTVLHITRTAVLFRLIVRLFGDCNLSCKVIQIHTLYMNSMYV